MPALTFTLVPDAPPTWAPLERLAAICARRAGLPAIIPTDFMHMGCLCAPGRPDVQLYKHIDTRRYLALDALGHAYQVGRGPSPARADSPLGRQQLRFTCRLHRDITSALTGVLAGYATSRSAQTAG